MIANMLLGNQRARAGISGGLVNEIELGEHGPRPDTGIAGLGGLTVDINSKGGSPKVTEVTRCTAEAL